MSSLFIAILLQPYLGLILFITHFLYYFRGHYFYFDCQNWRKSQKEFHLDYDKLEVRSLMLIKMMVRRSSYGLTDGKIHRVVGSPYDEICPYSRLCFFSELCSFFEHFLNHFFALSLAVVLSPALAYTSAPTWSSAFARSSAFAWSPAILCSPISLSFPFHHPVSFLQDRPALPNSFYSTHGQ